jgi:hypothetical protein
MDDALAVSASFQWLDFHRPADEALRGGHPALPPPNLLVDAGDPPPHLLLFATAVLGSQPAVQNREAVRGDELSHPYEGTDVWDQLHRPETAAETAPALLIRTMNAVE